MPVVIGVPHGGEIAPDSFPLRTCNFAFIFSDIYTVQLAQNIDSSFLNLNGCRPHIIICHLRRDKFDANRDKEDATCNHPYLKNVWDNYQNFILSAKDMVIQHYGRGLFLDLHGHGHIKQRLEIGYNLGHLELMQPNFLFNSNSGALGISTVKSLVSNNINSLNHAQLVKGATSIGSMFTNKGYPSCPSQSDPAPDVLDLFYPGGYNTEIHGSMNGGDFDAIQIECNFIGVLNTPQNRKIFADSFAVVVNEYLNEHIFGHNNFCYFSTNLANNNINKVSIKPKLFPNPFHKKLFLEGLNQNLFSYEIFSFTGELIYQNKSTSTELFVPDNIPSGIYFLKVYTSEQYFLFSAIKSM